LSNPHSIQDWIVHVFGQPATDPPWHFSPEPPSWVDSPANTAAFIADTFERSGELLAEFTDKQLDQGFWYLAYNTDSGPWSVFNDRAVPWALQQRTLRSIGTLFEQTMSARWHSPVLHPQTK
jgi:hypothetical protein